MKYIEEFEKPRGSGKPSEIPLDPEDYQNEKVRQAVEICRKKMALEEDEKWARREIKHCK